MSEFLAMGGYGAYVWTAFGVTLVLLLGFLLQSWQAARRSAAALEEARKLARGGREEAAPGAVLRPAVETAALERAGQPGDA